MTGVFRQVQVTKTPVRIQSLLVNSNDPFLLVNPDITNQIFIGNDQGTQPIPIPPLGSISLSSTAGHDTWISTGGGSFTVQALILPAGTNWSPSPAQIAAQLNTLGLAKDSTVSQVNTTLGTPSQDGTTSGINTTLVFGTNPNLNTINSTLGSPAQQVLPVPLCQLGAIGGAAAATIVPGTPFTALNLVDVKNYTSYDINLFAFSQSPGTVNANIVAQVVFQWFDSNGAGAIPVFEEDWWVWCGRAAPVAGFNTLSGCGPMHGRYLTVQVFTTNTAAVNMTLQYINIFGSARYVPSSDWRQNGSLVNPQSNGITAQLGGGSGFDNLLASVVNLTLGASALVFIPCGLYAGPVWYRFQCNNGVPLHNPVIANMNGQVSGGLGAGTATAGVLVNITADTLEHEGTFFAGRSPVAFIIQGAAAGTSQISLHMIGQQAA